MPIVPGICPQCGAKLNIDRSKDAAICEFCNTPFVVEKAINNVRFETNLKVDYADITIIGNNASNLFTRGEQCEKEGCIEDALDYYIRVLDINVNYPGAAEKVSRIKNQIAWHAYLSIPAIAFNRRGTLFLRRNGLAFVADSSSNHTYQLNKIRNVRGFANCIIFTRPDGIDVRIDVSNGVYCAEKIIKAQNGIWPRINLLLGDSF